MRTEPRYPICQIGVIESKNAPSHYCTVRDFSGNGVRINIACDVPNEFFLKFPGITTPWAGHYRVIWRREGEIGAERFNSEKARPLFGRPTIRLSPEIAPKNEGAH
jgi:hypothetical protein